MGRLDSLVKWVGIGAYTGLASFVRRGALAVAARKRRQSGCAEANGGQRLVSSTMSRESDVGKSNLLRVTDATN